MTSADSALQRLRDGNARYVAGKPVVASGDQRERRYQTAEAQRPFAAILACSDSRVPVETVFDQGIGDLFVVRVAGNVVGPSQAGSIEFAASVLGVRLVVVLGHTRCGAIEAVVAALENPAGESPGFLGYLVDRIRPAVERAITDDEQDREHLVEKSVRANIRHSVGILQNDSTIIRSLADDVGLRVVGAEYALQTGEIEFL